MNSLRVMWVSAHRKAQNPPDPNYPDGMHVDLTGGRQPFCVVAVPYPAPEIGRHLIACAACGNRVVVTAAGRFDDPKTVKVACRRILQ